MNVYDCLTRKTILDYTVEVVSVRERVCQGLKSSANTSALVNLDTKVPNSVHNLSFFVSVPRNGYCWNPYLADHDIPISAFAVISLV